MGRIIGKDLEDIVESIRDGKSTIGGGVAVAAAGLTATALVRKSLDAMTHAYDGYLAADEVKELDWELEDAEIHYVKLLDKDRESSALVYELVHKKEAHSITYETALTADEIYRAALSVSVAISTSAARVLNVAARLAEIAPSEYLSDIGIATQLLYATFIGGRMKLNHYIVHAPEMDSDFIARTRSKVYELEDEVSKLVGVSLERVWKTLHPKNV